MMLQYTPQLGMVGVLALCLVVLLLGLKHRRHRQRLRSLASKYSLAVVEGDVQKDALRLASRHERNTARVWLKDVLVGSDEEGLYYFAERRIGRRRHHLMFLETSSPTHLRGFHFGPAPKKERRGAPSSESGQIALSWNAKCAHWTDERTLSVATRVLFHTARSFEEAKGPALALEINDRRVLLRSYKAAKDDELEPFLVDTLRLRRKILESLRQVQRRNEGKPAKPRNTPSRPEPVRVR